MSFTKSYNEIDMLETEFKYYLDHQQELSEKFDGRFLIIVGEDVKGDYTTKKEAYFEGKERFGLGNFLIQHCVPGNLSISQTYYSHNVAF